MSGVRKHFNEDKYLLLGRYEVSCFQRINNPKVYLLFYSLFGVFATAMSVGIAYVNLEEFRVRFGFNNAELDLALIGYDIGFSVIAIFAAYIGTQHNRARQAVVGMMIFALGAVLYALPHFTTALYTPGGEVLKLTCSPNWSPDCSVDRSNEKYSFYLILFGQLIMGAGMSVFLVLGLSYIDDSVSKRASANYLGIANTAIITGTVVGVLCGMEIVDIYVDFDTTESTLPNYDVRYIGAWWLFPMITVAIALVLAIPLFGYPKHLPGTQESLKTKNEELDNHFERSEYCKDGLLKQLFSLFKNPTFVFITLSGCIQTLLLAGLNRVLPKLFENVYHLEIDKAPLLAGLITSVAGIAGVMTGGNIIYFFKWRTPGILKFCAGVLFAAALLSLSFLSYCDNIPIAGVTIEYESTSNLLSPENVTATSPCNSACKCREEFTVLVCGNDNITYLSPCHGGCTRIAAPYTYGSCSCVRPNLPANFTGQATTTVGACPSDCSNALLFAILFLILLTALYLCYTPAMIVSLRIVPRSMKALTLGLQLSLYRLIGNIPGPYIYEWLVESACLIWQKYQCDGKRGICLVYSNEPLSLTLMGITIGGCLIGMVLLLLGVFMYKPNNKLKEFEKPSDFSYDESQATKL